MANQSQVRTDTSTSNSSNWTGAQAYSMAVICLIVGIAVGYLLRGSSPATVSPQTQAMGAQQGGAPPMTPGMTGAEPSPEQLKHMADKQAEPLLAKLKETPNDPKLLADIGNLYYDAQQYPAAIGYYEQALKANPKDSNVRTDMATAYWYNHDVNRAIAEFDAVLKTDPSKTNALFNRGIVRWQGKMDVNGAVQDWQALLKADPNYPERGKVEMLIAQASKHANVKPGQKTDKPAM